MKTLAGLAIGLVVLGCRGDAQAPLAETTAVRVTCIAAGTGSERDAITLRGTVRAAPDREAMVAPAVAGRVRSIAVREGDRVMRGTLLAIVDDPALGPAVREADASVAAATAALGNAETASARATRLEREGIVPRRQVEEAAAQRASAAAALEAARARKDQASSQLARARVTAPIDGVVVRVLRRAGELVDGTPATPVVQLADLTSLEVRGDVPATQLVRVAEGAAADVTLDAAPDTHFSGRVLAIAVGIDPATGLGAIRVGIESPKGAAIRPRLGLAAMATVTSAAPRQIVSVPASAIRRSTDGGEEVVVCRSTAGGLRAAVRPVRVGSRRDGLQEIREGVVAGERVITDHVLGIEDGTVLEAAGGEP